MNNVRSCLGTTNLVAAVAVLVGLCMPVSAIAGVSYQDPDGGWLYKYEGDQGDTDELAALDGTWTHEINDRWDESAPGEPNSAPGGAGVFTEGDVTFLRIQDAGDPRDLGFEDNISNRKMTFNHLIHDLDGVSDAYLDEGFTFSFRARLATTPPLDDLILGGVEESWPAEGRGYDIDFDGTGFFLFVQPGGINPGNLAFSLADAEFALEDVDADVGGLTMNNLAEFDPDIPSGDVDTGEALDINLVPIEDLTQWHEFWITIQEGGEGTHQVNVYLDGSADPQTLDVTLGSADRGESFAMGPSYTTGATAVDVDFLAFSEGVLVPQAIGGLPALRAGDADQDLKFDQLDLVQVQIAAKYLTGQPATWGEGDWDGAPGGAPGSPPAGDGQFNQLDIIAALNGAVYLTGPYAAINPGPGSETDEQTSIVYNATTGELGVNAPASTELTSVNIDSATAIFTGEAAMNLGGSFDNDADGNIFKATFGSSFGSLSFGNVAQPGLSAEFVAGDLTVIGSLAGGGDLGSVDLIYVPEPSSLALAVIAILGAAVCSTRRRQS